MRTLWIVGVVVSLWTQGGCTPAEKAEVRQQVEGAADNVRQTAADTTLAGKVKAGLATRKGLDGTEINVEARGSEVTLTGDVATREQADLAEKVALETEGVQSVKNQLMLRVPARP